MCLYSANRLFTRIHGQWHGEVFVENTIRKHRQPGNVIQVRVRQENMTNRIDVLKFEITDTGAGIDQDIVVN